MEVYKRKLWDEHKRAIDEINIYWQEREKIIRDRETEVEKEKVSNLLRDLLSDPVFKIDKTCIDCDVDYEAKYHEIGGLNCHVCGLTSHGCKPNEKMQAAELCGMSKGYKWLCYDCTKEVKLIKEKNKNWEEGLEEHTKKDQKYGLQKMCFS